MNIHVQCHEIGCSFSATGKVVKGHMLTAHNKSNNSKSMVDLKATRKVLEEEDEETKAWREERTRNYPTRLNIQRKKEAMEGKLARGELIDEDSRKRRQRMKEILAKQAELGVPVAEVPAHYLSQLHKEDRTRGRKSTTMNGAFTSLNGTDSKKRKLVEDANATTGTEEQPSKSARVNLINCNIYCSADLPTKSECKNLQENMVGQVEIGSVPRHEDKEEAGGMSSDKVEKAQCYFYQRGRCKRGTSATLRTLGLVAKSSEMVKQAGVLRRLRPPRRSDFPPC